MHRDRAEERRNNGVDELAGRRNLGLAGAMTKSFDGALSRHGAARWAVAAAFVAAYPALEWVSFIHEFKGLPVTPWNPGLGVALALMIRRGPGYGLALFAGVIAAEFVDLQSAMAWQVILGIATVIAAGYAGVATVLRRRMAFDVGLGRLRDILVLLGAGVFGAASVTVALIALLLAAGVLETRDVGTAALPFLVGDVIGIAVTTPLLLRISKHWREGTLRRMLPALPESTLLGVVILGALWVIAGTESTAGFRAFYLLFLPVMFAAVRHGLDGACLSLAVTQLGLVGLLHRPGFEANSFTEVQLLMCVLTATGLIVGIVVSERREADRAARDFEDRLKEKEAEVAQAARFTLVSGMTSALAHEINQPMAAARALARSAQELLRRPDGDMARADRNLGLAIAEIDLASGIVRRMRDFLRRGQPHVSTLDVRGLLDDTLILIRPEAAARGIALDLDVAPGLPVVHGDRVQLQQVVLNLVRNAIDSISGAGRRDGRISVAAFRGANPAVLDIAVTDNGPGVAAEALDRLFQPLTTSKQEGLGLGLSICQAIVEAHGGRIRLHANAPGATEFRFSLPLEATITA